MARTKTSKAWMRRHVSDVYVRRAREQGYRSRAAFKLLEIAKRDHLLKPGMTVVDLGTAPGGWAQVAARLVGPRGAVVAVDLGDIAPIPGVAFVRGDFRDERVRGELERALAGRRVDLVLSDMSPNLSGVASVDQARGCELAGLALEFAEKHLKPQGIFLVKVFQGAGFESFLKVMRARFRQVVTRKPVASRAQSSEIYLLGKGLARGAGARS